MVKSGTKPSYRDNRDLDFHRNFGSFAGFSDNFSVDSGGFPNQNADGNPYECTAYCTCDIAKDEDSIEYLPGYLYAKTLLVSGDPPTTQGADIRTALKASTVYGLLPAGKASVELEDSSEGFNANYRNWPIALDLEAANHRRGQYFNVQPLGDWFDGIRSAIQKNNLPVSIGTPWYPEWEQVTSDGIISGLGKQMSGWHNWKIAGWKTIDGAPYLMGKTWQGPNYGDHGWIYFSRETINALWKIYGTQAFTIAKAGTQDIQTIKVDIIQTILSFLARLGNSLT